MSFAKDVKEELSLIEYSYSKDVLEGLFKASGNISLNSGVMSLSFKSENPKIATLVFKCIKELYEVKPITSIYKSMKLKKNNNYVLKINSKVNEILEDLHLLDFGNYKEIIKKNERMSAFLAGCFMGSGSVNDPKTTNYHLEFAFVDEDSASIVLKMLNKLHFNPKMIERRNQIIVYLKRAQEIADLIAFMGATNNYLEFENERMTRDFLNSDNRLNNCDIANSVRTNLAANEQIRNIEIISKAIGIDMLDEDLRILANLRLNNQEDSLKTLAIKYNKITNKEISKSGINHLFIKIANIASEYKGIKNEEN